MMSLSCEKNSVLSPKKIHERIAVLDILRGIAILLILPLNMPDMGNSMYGGTHLNSWQPADQFCWWVLEVGFAGTQRGLLQLLFGAGALIYLEKTMQPDGPVQIADLYFRRNFWLAVFGLFDVYGLLWFGDILFLYAICAFFLFPFRRLSGRVLLTISLLGISGTAVQNFAHYEQRRADYTTLTRALAMQANHQPLTSSDNQVLAGRQAKLAADHASFVAERAAHMGPFSAYRKWSIDFYEGPMAHVFLPWGLRISQTTLSLFLGAALFRFGITQGNRSARFYLILFAATYIPGFVMRVIFARQILSSSPSIGIFAGETCRLLVTVGYVALVNFAVKSRLGSRLLAPLQAVGRTAFSVYLMQNFIGMWILFPAFGLGLWGRYSWFGLTMLSLVIIAVQVVLSNVWLRYFTIGPLEWVWRSLTYQRLQVFRRMDAKPERLILTPN